MREAASGIEHKYWYTGIVSRLRLIRAKKMEYAMEKTEEKLLLVDGHNLLFQMFYGMPARIVNREGKAIQGTLGFVGALLKIIRRVQPSHVAVIFDGEHENRRRDIAEDYKANRPDYSQAPEEENPFSQLPDVYRALHYMAIPYWETREYEADDEIAAYVYAYGELSEQCIAESDSHSQTSAGCAQQGNPVTGKSCVQQENSNAENRRAKAGDGMQIVISSHDSDFFQLIRENVSILRYRGEKTLLWDGAHIREKLGIEPSQYAPYKALTGDKADNIAGIRGVGPKTAAGLMRQFGSLEELLAHKNEIKKPSIQKVLTEAEEQLRRNYQLIRLDGRVPVPRPLEELAWQDGGLTTTEVLAGIGLK